MPWRRRPRVGSPISMGVWGHHQRLCASATPPLVHALVSMGEGCFLDVDGMAAPPEHVCVRDTPPLSLGDGRGLLPWSRWCTPWYHWEKGASFTSTGEGECLGLDGLEARRAHAWVSATPRALWVTPWTRRPLRGSLPSMVWGETT